MVRLKFARLLVVALIFSLSVAVNAQGIRPVQAASASLHRASVTVLGANVLPPPTDPQLPPGVTDRGIIWGD